MTRGDMHNEVVTINVYFSRCALSVIEQISEILVEVRTQ